MSQMSIPNVRELMEGQPEGGGCFGRRPSADFEPVAGPWPWMPSSPDIQPWMVSSPDPSVLDRRLNGGMGTDEDQIRRTLMGQTPEQIGTVGRRYKEKYGDDGGFWGKAGNALQSGLSSVGSWFGF